MNFPEPGQTFPGKNDVYIFIIYIKIILSHMFAARVMACFWTLLFVYIDDHIWKVNKLFFFYFESIFHSVSYLQTGNT